MRSPTSRSRMRRSLSIGALAFVVASLGLQGVLAAPERPRPILEQRTTLLSGPAVGVGWTRTAEVTSPTQMVGFDWTSPGEAAVEVRALRNGAWGPWLELHGDPT